MSELVTQWLNNMDLRDASASKNCPLISLSVLVNYCLWDCCHLLISSCHQWNYPWSLPLIALIQFSYYFDYYLCLLWLPFTESVLMFAVWDETLPRLAKPILWGLNWKRDWCGKSLLDPKSPQQWIFQVCQYERLVVCGTTLEEATQRGPGLVFVLPFLETATLVDIRVKVFEVWWFRWTVFLSGAANVKIFVFFLVIRCLPSRSSPLTPSLSLWMLLFITGCLDLSSKNLSLNFYANFGLHQYFCTVLLTQSGRQWHFWITTWWEFVWWHVIKSIGDPCFYHDHNLHHLHPLKWRQWEALPPQLLVAFWAPTNSTSCCLRGENYKQQHFLYHVSNVFNCIQILCYIGKRKTQYVNEKLTKKCKQILRADIHHNHDDDHDHNHNNHLSSRKIFILFISTTEDSKSLRTQCLVLIIYRNILSTAAKLRRRKTQGKVQESPQTQQLEMWKGRVRLLLQPESFGTPPRRQHTQALTCQLGCWPQTCIPWSCKVPGTQLPPQSVQHRNLPAFHRALQSCWTGPQLRKWLSPVDSTYPREADSRISLRVSPWCRSWNYKRDPLRRVSVSGSIFCALSVWDLCSNLSWRDRLLWPTKFCLGCWTGWCWSGRSPRHEPRRCRWRMR